MTKRSASALAMGIFLSLLAMPLIPANEISALEPEHKSISVALIGDSYTAGNGAGSYNGPRGTYQSSKNWGNIYASWLKTQGVKATLTNLSVSGSKTKDLMDAQLPKVPQNTDLVMLTIGGNDASFGDVVKKCFATGLRSSTECRKSVNNAKSQFDGIINKTNEIFSELSANLSSTSQIVLVGYPYLSLDSDYTLKTCVKFDTHTDTCVKYDTYPASKEVLKAGEEFNKKQRTMVDKWNSSHDLKITFVDTIQSSFSTHEPNPFATGKNPIRWINEFFETEGEINNKGNTSGKYSLDMNNWYHPNITGHRKTALDIINTVGIPASAKPITPTSSNIDVAFVIDTTGSMGGSIDQAKRDATSIATAIASSSNSARFALIDYQDHPVEGGAPDDYPAKVQLPFTQSLTNFDSAVNGLLLGDGGDWEETVHSGSMAAFGLDWRPGVRKIAIIIGDAPAKNPEPVTGYTWQQVAKRAYDIDPVEIYTIDTWYGYLTRDLAELVAQSGGKSLNSGGDLSSAIISSINHSLAKPFGWIQGPYIIKIGESLELDARGSYVVDGTIKKIEWDLDGDGVFEKETSELLINHIFTNEFGGTIGVKITDSNNNVGIGSTRLDVTDDGDSIPRSSDNCPDVANQNQADYDNDSIGDDCDDDIGLPTKDIDGVFVANGENDDNLATPIAPDSSSQSTKQIEKANSQKSQLTEYVLGSTSLNKILNPRPIASPTSKPLATEERLIKSPTGSNTIRLIAIIIGGATLVMVTSFGMHRYKQKR